ncbi:MAG: type II toxin-antitoxin system RelE/ParE family toxin [Rhodobacteraceae bacterium]|nr:type II toxin-antitoxin system RelE/ParE family toxin [Paracoccaceae bacterium]
MSYRLTREAEEDLITIAERGIELFGENQARAYHNALYDVFELISANPKMVRERLELSPPVRIHPFKAHMIIYQIKGDTVLIIRVRHGREDWLTQPV